jgi:mannosyltransferase OCH1-like enzyme
MLRNYKDFREFIKNYEDDGSIPKIIYRTSPFKFEEIPQVILESYQKDLEKSPEYSMFYFDDFDCQCFIEENYGIEYLSLYNKLIPTAFKADLFRYLLLYKHGGVWMDFSMSLNTPLDKIIAQFKQVYVRDRIHLMHGNWMNKVAIYQGFLCTIKGTDVLRITIERCLKNIKDRNLTLSCLAVTGTILLGMVYRELGIDGTNSLGENTESTKIGYIPNSIYMYAYEYEHDNVILDNDTPIINIKHPDHYSLIYKNRDHYGELWNQQKVFL